MTKQVDADRYQSPEPSEVEVRQSFSTRLSLKWVQAWQSEAWWLWLLLPFSWLYGFITWLRYQLYNHQILSSYRAPVAVMVVGNINVGGSGKTPLIIELVSFLQKNQVKVAVISRGYGGDETQMPCLVTAQSQPKVVGDEPCLIVRETGVTMAVCPNRKQAIECLLTHAPDTQLIIADDGLQHYKLQRDIEWIVVDSDRGFGNSQLLPAGFLREPLKRLQKPNATVICHQAAPTQAQPTEVTSTVYKEADNLDSVYRKTDCLKTVASQYTMYLAPAPMRPLNFIQEYSSQLGHSAELALPLQRVYGLSGIGYPQRFFNTLSQLGFDVVPKPMPDHHQFHLTDLQNLTKYPIVITSKDAVKIAPLIRQHKSLGHLQVWVLPVHAVLSDNCYQHLWQQLVPLIEIEGSENHD